MERAKEILVCHGYEVYPDGTLSEMCEAVCRDVARRHSSYDQIILLAGQHRQGLTLTVDEFMLTQLITLGVPGNKIVPWTRICPTQRPPRTTREEVYLLPHVLRGIGYAPRAPWFDVACHASYTKLIEVLYHHFGAKLGLIHGASSKFNPVRYAVATASYLIARVKPEWEDPLYRRILLSRSVFPTQPNGQPWQENLPSDWND